MGYQVEHFLFRNQVRSETIVSDYTPAFWLSAGIDTRDDAFVPKNGVYFQTQAKWEHRAFLYEQVQTQGQLTPSLVRDAAHGAFSYKQVQTKLAYFASPHPQLSLGFWSQGGYVTQFAPFDENFLLGGAGHFSNAALRVVGLRRDELAASRFVSARISIWSHLRFWESTLREGTNTSDSFWL